jgi:hypothetical protein
MKLMRLTRHDAGELYGYRFLCPGCGNEHNVLTTGPNAWQFILTTGPNVWQFNGDLERPTFSPSILAYEIKGRDGTVFSPRCHSFVRDGRIQFLADCGHALAGKTVDLPDVEVDLPDVEAP